MTRQEIEARCVEFAVEHGLGFSYTDDDVLIMRVVVRGEMFETTMPMGQRFMTDASYALDVWFASTSRWLRDELKLEDT